MRRVRGVRTVDRMTTDTTVPQPATTGPRQRVLEGTTIVERRIEAAGISTAVLECGSGPPVLMLHGPAEAAIGWLDTIVGLGGTHRVIAPDVPGHGESEAPAHLDRERTLAWLDDVIGATCA